MKIITVTLDASFASINCKPSPSRQIEKKILSNVECTLVSANSEELVLKMNDDDVVKLETLINEAVGEINTDTEPEGAYQIRVENYEPVSEEDFIEEEATLTEEQEKVADGFAPLEGELPFADIDTDSGESTEEKSKEYIPPYDLESLLNEVPMKHSEELKKYLRETNMVIPMLKKMDNERCIWSQNLLVSIDTGFGLTTFLKTLVKIHINNDLLEDREELDTCFAEIKLTRKESDKDIDEIWGGFVDGVYKYERMAKRKKLTVVCIDISDYLPILNSSKISNYLKELADSAENFICVFRIPFMEQSAVDEVAATLEDVMNIRTLCVPPIPMDDMVAYMKNRLKRMGIDSDDKCNEGLESCLLLEKNDDSFFGYKTLNKVIDRVVYEKALKNAQNGEMSSKLDPSDIIIGDVSVLNDFDPTEKLRELVGMEAISQQISEIIAQMKVAKEMAASGADVDKPSIHMMFTGNPGTGKTTVARIVAKIMKEQGILRKGHMHEYRGRDLCGRYIGETAPKTSAICRDAYGSVLFIDEAYSLFRGDDDSRDYGREALDTLVAEMENHRDDMCVIFAGYTDEMNTMLNGNAGLRSRIPYIIEFPNYTREELAEIFFKMAENKFEYDGEFENAVREFFINLPDETFESKDFSNARFVRNLYEKVWGKAAYRKTIGGEEKLILLKSDLENVARGDEFKVLKDKKTKKIGFV